jgi:hypothetical protein
MQNERIISSSFGVDSIGLPPDSTLHCKSSCSLRYLYFVLIAAVYASRRRRLRQSYPIIDLINLFNNQRQLILNGMGEGEAMGLRIGERGEEISRFLSASEIDGCCFRFIWLYLCPCGYRFFILRNTYAMGTSMYRAALLRVCACDKCSAGTR